MSTPRILIFDSGVGGLSIAQCIRQTVPAASLVYLADNACFPYGDQPEELVTERCLALIADTLVAYPTDLIVVACNTASTVVLPRLREMTHLPVVGVVPAIKPAAAVSQNRRIGILATPATIRRPYLEQLIREFASDCQLERIGHPELVRWVEAWVTGQPLPLGQLGAALAPFREARTDTVVLGCTHYPLIRGQLETLVPGVKHWIDSGEAIARRTEFLLRQVGYDLDVGAEPGDGWTPVAAVLFTGALPERIADFMAARSLAPATQQGHWLAERGTTAIGSV